MFAALFSSILTPHWQTVCWLYLHLRWWQETQFLWSESSLSLRPPGVCKNTELTLWKVSSRAPESESLSAEPTEGSDGLNAKQFVWHKRICRRNTFPRCEPGRRWPAGTGNLFRGGGREGGGRQILFRQIGRLIKRTSHRNPGPESAPLCQGASNQCRAKKICS